MNAEGDITAVIITKNEESKIRACLDQVTKLTKEIIIVDDESTDQTREIAQDEYGALVIVSRSNDWLARQRNIGAEQVKTQWFVSIDADEILTNESILRIRQALNSADKNVGAFKVKRLNYFFGKPIYHAGAFHSLVKIFRKECRDKEKVQHENWTIKGNVQDIDTVFEHHPFSSMEKIFKREIRYTKREGRAYVDTRDKITFQEIKKGLFIKTLKAFWKAYIKKRGRKDGMHGFMFCFIHHVLRPAMRWCFIWEESIRQNKLDQQRQDKRLKK